MADTPDFSPEAIAEALREATPEPWECWQDNPSLPGMWCVGRPEEVEGQSGDSSAFVAGEVWDEADAHLIANAPTWLAQLLAALEAERAAHASALDEARAARENELVACEDRTTAEAALEAEWVEHTEDLASMTHALHVANENTLTVAATAEAALEAKDGEVARLRVAWQRSFAMLRATYPHPDHVPLVVERVIDMMAAALAPSTPTEQP